MSYKTRWKQKGGSILWTYVKTNKLPSTSSKQQYADSYLSNMFTIISLDSHNGDEKRYLVQHKEVVVTCEENMGATNEY